MEIEPKNSLDVPLDDLIKKDRSQGRDRENRTRGRRGRRGPIFRETKSISRETFRNRGPYRARRTQSTSVTFGTGASADDSVWKHDLFENEGKAEEITRRTPRERNVSTINLGAKVRITNLNYNIMEQDLKRFLNPIGEIERISIHYDRTGRSKGVADVTFSRQSDAEKCIREFNGKTLENRDLKIFFLSSNIQSSDLSRIVITARTGNSSRRSFNEGDRRERRRRGGFRSRRGDTMDL